jgi:hypothetical protein
MRPELTRMKTKKGEPSATDNDTVFSEMDVSGFGSSSKTYIERAIRSAILVENESITSASTSSSVKSAWMSESTTVSLRAWSTVVSGSGTGVAESITDADV